jgi:magnesium and cobalt transporter
MSEDSSGSTTGRWLRRITQSMSGEPENRAELVKVLREAAERGLLDADALSMIEGVLAVSDLLVRDIMVPRSQMASIERDAALDDIVPMVVESGHSRFPVIGDDRDAIAGILLAKDLLRYTSGEQTAEFDIKELMRPTVFVPESKRLDVLLREFRASRNHMAIVVDEYGGVAGLVTLEDVIEQIIGDIDDEYDIEEDQPIKRESERQFIVLALTRLEEFNQYFGTKFEDDSFDTVGGLVMHELGRLPRKGDTFKVRDLEFRVLRADRRRVEAVRVTTSRDIVPQDPEHAATVIVEPPKAKARKPRKKKEPTSGVPSPLSGGEG